MTTPQEPEQSAGSSLFGPTTDADHRRWQARDHHALGMLLKDASAAKLAPLTWTLRDIGGLHGRVPANGLPVDQRALFTAWIVHLGLTPWPERKNGDGWAHLHAVGMLPDRYARRTGVAITADVAPVDPSGLYDLTTEEC